MPDVTVTLPVYTKVGDGELIHLGDWTLSMSELAALKGDPSRRVLGLQPIP